VIDAPTTATTKLAHPRRSPQVRAQVMHHRQTRTGSVLGSVTTGIAPSARRTLAMDVTFYRRCRHDDGNATFVAWEFSEDKEC
jgi:hypothetical protein